MSLTKQQLYDTFVTPGHATEADFEKICESADADQDTLEEVFIAQSPLKATDVGRGLAEAYGVPYADISKQTIPHETLHFLPERVARTQQTVVYEVNPTEVRIATAHPDSHEFLSSVTQKMGRPTSIRYALPGEIETALRGYQGSLEERLQQVTAQENESEETRGQQGVEIVNVLLGAAYDAGSSDIHLEPQKDSAIVRFRIDGILKKVNQHEKSVHEKIVARIKILAGLRTDEHAAPQDGRFTFDGRGGRTFDLRVSVAPVTGGENVVLRLLRQDTNTIGLSEIGLLHDNLQLLKDAAQRSHGMILTVGPTGSGKTTTLYTLLETINSEARNIMTIEDPIEYNVEYVQQMQVNPAKDVRFSTGLRTIVRQDPDVILVGEIRDQETADIAINAAMTGHLLFSSLHTNDAATTFPRLAEMGVEAFLVASSVNIVVAQRLVRKLCSACRKSTTLNQTARDALNVSPEIHNELIRQSGKDDIEDILLYSSPGCNTCHNVGYVGRVGIFEVLEVTDDIRSLILRGASASEINRVAVEGGMKTMMSHGVEKVLRGVTGIEDLMRVLRS